MVLQRGICLCGIRIRAGKRFSSNRRGRTSEDRDVSTLHRMPLTPRSNATLHQAGLIAETAKMEFPAPQRKSATARRGKLWRIMPNEVARM